MRRAERPPRHERLADRQHARHGVDLRGLERLVETHLREDGGEPPGEHRLAAARRADHQPYIISRPLTRAWDMVKAPAKTSPPPKAYSYIRWSTPEQSKGDSSRRQTEAEIGRASCRERV